MFVTYTDSETWAGGVHPAHALADYRRASGIDARLVVVGMVSNGFSIADPSAGMLDVVGFDTATPQLISDFARGPPRDAGRPAGHSRRDVVGGGAPPCLRSSVELERRASNPGGRGSNPLGGLLHTCPGAHRKSSPLLPRAPEVRILLDRRVGPPGCAGRCRLGATPVISPAVATRAGGVGFYVRQIFPDDTS